MPLSAGDRLGPYEILSPVGAGGMGEVYRAHDSRVGRDVAIKISKEQFSERFDREVRAVAALNHSNICHLYDVGPNYLVMEFVEGEAPRGPMPLNEALEIARQIAAALEAAHEKGIVHRDLKPANIKITPDGTVKVLDFGLAKNIPASSTSTVNSPTLSMSATQAGAILGTAAYMSPEQARGKPVDKRADIWAFGAVLYELLMGRPLFRGEDVSEIFASVIKDEPKLEGVPAEVRALLRACLEKDPKLRLRDIGDAWALLRTDAIIPPPVKRGANWPAWAVAAIMTVAAAVALWAPWRAAAPPLGVFSYRLFLPQTSIYSDTGWFGVSPDGRKMAFHANAANGAPRIWVQPLDSLGEATPLAGTEGSVYPPFWLFDSRWVAFARNGKLVKVNIAGGAPVTLCDLDRKILVGGSENAGGRILFGTGNDIIWQVPSTGGTAVPVTRLEPSRQESAHSQPIFLPDGRHFVYFRRSDSMEKMGAYIGDLEAAPERQSLQPLLGNRTGVRLARPRGPHPGFLLFLRDANLFAQAFDEKTFKLAGDPVRVADQVGSFLDIGNFSVSDAGVLVYRNGTSSSYQLTWFDRQGKRVATVGPPTAVEGGPVLSPSGTQALVGRLSGQNVFDLWRVDLERKNETRLSGHPNSEDTPVWSPNGNEFVLSSGLGDRFAIYRMPINGGREELLLDSAERVLASDWSRDGRFLLYTVMDPKTGPDIWALRLDDPKKKARLLGSAAAEKYGSFSPNMRWITYSSTEVDGVEQVFVRELLPEPGENLFHVGPAQIISSNGGAMPAWSADGKELFYQTGDSSLMAATIGGSNRASGPLDPGEPVRLFQDASILPFMRNWAVTRDGQRFLSVSPVQQEAQKPFNVVINWQESLRK
jgi:eukaryotic-like serine/threonine-protein kinase